MWIILFCENGYGFQNVHFWSVLITEYTECESFCPVVRIGFPPNSAPCKRIHMCLHQGEGTQPPSLLSPPGVGSVRLCNAMETKLPSSPSLPHPTQTKLFAQHETVVMYWQKLPASLAQISATGGKEYTKHSIQYTVQTFSWLLLSSAAESLASGPQSGKAQYHSLTLPHLLYLYISGLHTWTQKRKATLACGWGGVGAQFGRLDRKPGTLYTLWSLCLIWRDNDDFRCRKAFEDFDLDGDGAISTAVC